jgi:hypothetical protein
METIVTFLEEWIWILAELTAFLIIMGTFAYLVWEGTIGWESVMEQESDSE